MQIDPELKAMVEDLHNPEERAFYEAGMDLFSRGMAQGQSRGDVGLRVMHIVGLIYKTDDTIRAQIEMRNQMQRNR